MGYQINLSVICLKKCNIVFYIYKITVFKKKKTIDSGTNKNWYNNWSLVSIWTSELFFPPVSSSSSSLLLLHFLFNLLGWCSVCLMFVNKVYQKNNNLRVFFVRSLVVQELNICEFTKMYLFFISFLFIYFY